MPGQGIDKRRAETDTRRSAEDPGPIRGLSGKRWGCLASSALRCSFEGVVYRSFDHARSAAKTNDLRWRAKIKECGAGKAAILMSGRRSGCPLRPDWGAVRGNLTSVLVESGVRQSEQARAALAQSGSREILHTPLPGEWVGAFFTPGANGRGENRYGKALVQIREKLARENSAFGVPAVALAPELGATEVNEMAAGMFEDDEITASQQKEPEIIVASDSGSSNPATSTDDASAGLFGSSTHPVVPAAVASSSAVANVSLADGAAPPTIAAVARTSSLGGGAGAGEAVNEEQGTVGDGDTIGSGTTVAPNDAVAAHTHPASSKAAKDELRRIREERRKLHAQELSVRKHLKVLTKNDSTQVNPGDHHGRGHARLGRHNKKKRKAELEQQRVGRPQQRQRPADPGPKACVFYGEGDQNRCTNHECNRAHTPAISKINVQRWARKAANAVGPLPRQGKQPVGTGTARNGRLARFDKLKGYGFIEPDDYNRGANRAKQVIFFHVKDWVGSLDTSPATSYRGAINVRYVRAVDTRAHGKWKATCVSRR